MTFTATQNNEQHGLELFVPTADQRYLLGEDVFVRTHFPVSFRRYKRNDIVSTLKEEELLEAILNPVQHTPGNRIWVIYGTPGSGKSEVMRWLETRIKQENSSRAAAMVRISRNELHAFRIVERFQELLSNDFLASAMKRQWDLARQKPRALTKLLLLFALENLLDSDELINALFYRLLNIVQPHVERILEIGSNSQVNQALELLSLEAWEAVSRETAIPITFTYEQFRYQLTTAFNAHLLEGLSLSKTLRHVSQEVQLKYGVRPLLLVDDLVQSLNIFASDFLDYFITLEEGNWDVVIGLTSAAFETSQRGRLLLERITHLDTIDDRVEKLWLSDEAGLDSYILSEDNCHLFAAKYFSEYYASNAQRATSLYPFNRELLVRIYRALPRGKGKLRYFLRYLREVLEAVQQGTPLLNSVEKVARVEYMALCEDKELARICELYGPIVADPGVREVILSQEVLQLVGKSDKRSIPVAIEPLFLAHSNQKNEINILSDDDEKNTIRDWLSGKQVNRQLLRALRLGATRLLRATNFSASIYCPDIARPYGILSWQKPYLGANPPILLEGVDEGDGILITRKVNHVAFDLYRYAHSRGEETKRLERNLLNDPAIATFILAAYQYQEQMGTLLATQLGLPLERFALSLYLWSICLHRELLKETAPLPPLILEEISGYTHYPVRTRMRENLHEEWVQLFEDFFKLRENIYNGSRLIELCEGRSAKDILDDIFCVEASAIGSEYHWGGRPLSQEVAEWQRQLQPIQSRFILDIHQDYPPHLSVWVEKVYQAGHEGMALADLPIDVLLELLQGSKQFPSGFRLCLFPE